MTDDFQRLLTMSGPEALSLNAQAALGTERTPAPSQFSHLVRHFLERFFNHETASPDGDAKSRLVLASVVAGLPGFVVALWLWPVYHPFRGWPPGNPSNGAPPSYWLQVNHHLFFILYSFVVMGIVTVFEWDLFFPDLLDVLVLQTLPIAEMKVFRARVAAIAIFIGAFLFNANILAPIFLPAATDPPNLPRFLAGHLVAVAASGLFAATSILALQGVLLSLLGERVFRKLSLLLQGLLIPSLLVLIPLFPILSSLSRMAFQSGSRYALWFPPFWFLGIDQRILEGPAAMPFYTLLAKTGCLALFSSSALAVLSYPLAYVRQVHRLIEGPGTTFRRNRLARPLDWLLHSTFLRPPSRRAVFHFIQQTILRVPRYRIYLVIYFGVGISIVASSILRISVHQQRVQLAVSADGMRTAIAIIAFWIIAGLRMALISRGNGHGGWIFPIIHGQPPHFTAAIELLSAARVYVLLSSIATTVAACLIFRTFAPPELLTPNATATQILMTLALCILLTDLFFFRTTTVSFTGPATREPPNLALSVLKYVASLSFVASLPLALDPWIESSVGHMILFAAAVAAIHWMLRLRYRDNLRQFCNLPALEEDEDDFPMKLGLRY